MFRCTEAKTVDLLLGQLPQVPILRVLPASSSQDTPHGEDGIYYRTTNEDRLAHSEQRLIEQTDILNLPKGEIFCRIEGGKPHKLRTPLLQAISDREIPAAVQDLLCSMKLDTPLEVLRVI